MNKCISCGEGESSDDKYSPTSDILLEGGEFLNETYTKLRDCANQQEFFIFRRNTAVKFSWLHRASTISNTLSSN